MNNLINNETFLITLGGDIKLLHSTGVSNSELVLNVYDFSKESGTAPLTFKDIKQILDPMSNEFSKMFKTVMNFIQTDLKFYHVDNCGVQTGYKIKQYLVAMINENDIIVNTMNDEDCWVESSFVTYLEGLTKRNDVIGIMGKYLYLKYAVQKVLRHPYTQEYIDFGVRYQEGLVEFDQNDTSLLKF